MIIQYAILLQNQNDLKYAKVCHLIFLKALHVFNQATQNIYEHDVIGWFTVCISEVRWPY